MVVSKSRIYPKRGKNPASSSVWRANFSDVCGQMSPDESQWHWLRGHLMIHSENTPGLLTQTPQNPHRKQCNTQELRPVAAMQMKRTSARTKGRVDRSVHRHTSEWRLCEAAACSWKHFERNYFDSENLLSCRAAKQINSTQNPAWN